MTLKDPSRGRIRLTGRLADRRAADSRPGRATESDQLLVLVHGLGGFSGSHYMVDAARTAHRMGIPTLRLNLRGADRLGHDYYHAGLTADLHAAIGSADLARYRRIVLLGFSLGGHVALRYATERVDPRVAAVAAVCPPLDLAEAAKAIDQPTRDLYRRYVLRGLRQIYEEVARRGPVPIPVSEARRIDTFRQWDDRVVAPRHGFAGAEDYWARASVGPLLGRIRLPSMVVAAGRDPMIPESAVRPALQAATEVRAVWLERGGHVGFPPGLDAGLGPGNGPVEQVVAWLSSPQRPRHPSS